MLIKPFPKVEGIHAVVLPLPGDIDLITVNYFIVGRGPLTLIDTGPKFPGSVEITQRHLEPLGFDISDIDRIIITHGHLDHFGQAVSIREAAGHPVECIIHADDKWRVSLEDYHEDSWSTEADNFMAKVDMPPKGIEKVKKRFAYFKKLSDPLDEVSTMEDKDELIGDDYLFRVIHTPGHSPGTVCIYESQRKVLFSGDHIIKHITPNPMIEMRRDRLKNPNYQSLGAFIHSLDKLTELDARFVFPGHGEYIENLPGILSSYILHHKQRMDMVWEALKKRSRPIYHLMNDVFPSVPENDVFFAVSEILVHLEMLIAEGRAEIIDQGPPVLYQAL